MILEISKKVRMDRNPVLIAYLTYISGHECIFWKKSSVLRRFKYKSIELITKFCKIKPKSPVTENKL